MAICDYRYRFVCIDVGAQGRQSDGGVFANLSMGQRFKDGRMDLPPAHDIGNTGHILPYALLGDEAFGLKPWLTTRENRQAKCRIARKFLITTTVNNIVKATTCLHNFCIMNQNSKTQQSYRYITRQMIDKFDNGILVNGEDCGLDKIQRSRPKNPLAISKYNRDTMADYFMEDGEVLWQYNAVDAEAKKTVIMNVFRVIY